MQPHPIAAGAVPHSPRDAIAVPLGDFAVAPDGSLRERWPGARPALHFRWKGLPCAAILSPEGLELRAEAGRVPSTLHRGARRSAALDALRALPEALPPGWRMVLEPDHRVGLGTVAAIETPTTVPALLAALVRFALALDPYRDQLAEAGMEMAGSAPDGSAST